MFNNQELLLLVIISTILMNLYVIQGGYCDEKLDAGRCYESIGEGMWKKRSLKTIFEDNMEENSLN